MAKAKRTGLFFGSFNPVHMGHLVVANYFDQFGNLDEVWFIVSPQNPLKENSYLLPDNQRLEMVHRAIKGYDRFRASSVEFTMPRPSYTIDTLTCLSGKYPDNDFFLLMGSDQLPDFYKWKNHEQLLKYYRIMVYPRPGFSGHELIKHPNVTLVKAPQIEISASFIRQSIKNGKEIRFFLPPAVWNYIREMNFYR
ncbi:MAG: nicotinate-nucleotide adenylyltransferase [Bacteroidales bacterium]|nr:nicotinate-nucleotide adenylyltransferase [Bacteroidales bacterium]